MATADNERQWAVDLAWACKPVVERLALNASVSDQDASDALLVMINGVEEFDEGKLG